MLNLEKLLDLSEIRIEKIDESEPGKLIFYVETMETETCCHVCGKIINKRHGKDRERTIRHLPAFGNQVYIVYQPNRYICENCDNNPTTTATPSWHSPNSSYTKTYEQLSICVS